MADTVFKAAAIQMVSTSDIQVNLLSAQKLIHEAAAQNAKLIVLPENFAYMGLTDLDRNAHAEEFGLGEIQGFLSRAACDDKVYLVAGSLALKSDKPSKVRSTTLVYDPQGQLIGHYDKIHMFDVTVDDNVGMYQESASTLPGDKAVVIDTELGRIGLSICYDLRFPEHYRALLAQGAQILLVPSAFTKTTGASHWEVLLRARAIENLCYVIAPNQGGVHENCRQTFGHTMIISPWGEILSRCDTGFDLAIAEINLTALQQQRDAFPAVSTALRLRGALFNRYA